MTVTLETVALDPARREGQDGIEPVQGLNGALFIHAEDGGMFGRVQIQADDVGRFALEVGIVAGHVTLQPMRLQARLLPDAVHGILADTQLSRQFAATPVRGTVLRFSASGRKDPGPQLRREHRCGLTGMAGIQPVDAGSQEPLLPAADGGCRGCQPFFDGVPGGAVGQHQDQPGTKCVPGRQRARHRDAAEFPPLVFREHHCIVDAHHIRRNQNQ